MEDWSVDGILINFEIPKTLLSRLNHIPFVQTEARVGTTLPSVFMDQEHGTRQAIQHLLQLGHTQICEIAGPMQIQAASASIRHDACQAALKQAGLQLVYSIQGDWSVDSGYHAARQLLAMGSEFTAIFAANDEMALGAICALREHGLSVPADVSVVGFDDIPVSAYVAPSLTTIRHSSADLGSEAIKYLVKLIGNPKSKPEQHVILPELVQRASTAPLF
jgi:DNA-binding LacI/PurR family transcriptional regulator